MNNTIASKVQKHFSANPLKTYSKGEIITAANESPTGISYIEDGVVEEYDISPSGSIVVVNIFRVSAFFPMSWAMNKTPNRYYFRALTNVTVRQESPEQTIEFVKQNPDVLYDLLERVFRGADALLLRLSLATGSASNKRLLYELLLEAYRFGIDAGKGQKQISIRQNTLAARSGLARETVSREIQQLEKSGYIFRGKQGIVIRVDLIEKTLKLSLT